ncbi:glycerophosphodiester phosphodiesterase [Nonomuraea sp. NPDC048826]|uniref:glycerophosphodiester phosphodiesterase n=1 Tax=Nonomuraea sp. NPDC048826 TaxID=3364347 RepID=UPI0037151A9D
MTKMHSGVVLAAASAAMAVMAGTALTATAASAAKARRCPVVFGHGGYPEGPDASRKDRIRQANNPSAVKDMRRAGADGVEADVQLTRHGTKAVMWHNTTTNGLTGPRRAITDLWWKTGPDNLRDRRISRGPYKGERVYTLREWLDHARASRSFVLLEIKYQAREILASRQYGEAGWREISGPIRERQHRQPIMVYSTDPWIQSELERRHPELIKGPEARWTDGVAWDEPPPSWRGNQTRWQSILKLRPLSVMTNYPGAYRRWVAERCT